MYSQKNRKRVKELIIELLDCRDERRQSVIVQELNHISPDPEHIDYIYQSEDFTDEDGNVDIDGVVDRIFRYKPIRL